MVRFSDEVYGGIVVLVLGHHGRLGAVWVDEPAVHELDSRLVEELEFAA